MMIGMKFGLIGFLFGPLQNISTNWSHSTPVNVGQGISCLLLA